MQRKSQPPIFEPLRFLRMAHNDGSLRKEIEADTGSDLIDLEQKAKDSKLNVKEHQALKVLYNMYVPNYDNYRKKYQEA